MNIQKVKAAIFDLDGTLLDTMADIGTSANTALCRCGFSPYPIESYRARIGHGIRTLLAGCLPEGTDPAIVDQVVRIHREFYPEHCTVHTDYYPGVREFLDQLTRRGIRLAIISNKTESIARKIVEHYFGSYDWAFVWGNDGQRPLKPALEAGHLACQTLNLQPEEILYVGDGDTDMEFGSSMGFHTVGVTWGYRDPDQLLTAGAHKLVDSFAELEQLF